LHQVGVVAGMEEAIRWEVAGRGEFSDGHGDFVAGVAAGTVHAVFHYFVAQEVTVGDAEVEVFEEGGNASEEADALDAAGFGLIEEGMDEKAAGAVALGVGPDDDGADLGEVRAVDVEGGAADELAGAGFDDGEGVDVFADFRVGAVEEGAVAGEAFNQVMDGLGVVQLRFACVQGGWFGFAFVRG
jgi:hypothetical protein